MRPENIGQQFEGRNLTEDEQSLIASNSYDPAKHDKYPKKQKRVIAYEDLQHGNTYCPTCAKAEPHANPTSNPFIRVHYNTEHDSKSGDFLTCSAGCGKTIVGRKGYYN